MKKYFSILFITLIVITLFSAILRFYKLPQRQYWMVDEERDAFIVKSIIRDKHFTLIGGALPGGFYLAPGYFYISALFYFFTKLNPIGMGYVAAFSGVVSTPIIFYITRKLFKNSVAFFAALFYTFSYLTVIYNRTWWPLTFSPLISLFVYFFLYQIIKTKNLKWVIPLTLTLIIAVQSDPSNLATLFLVILSWFLFRLPIKSKIVASSIIAFMLSHASLVLFDLRHDFLNSRAVVKFLIGHTGAGINFNPQTLLETLLLLPRSLTRFFWVFGDKDAALQIVPAPIYVQAKLTAIPGFLLAAAICILVWFVIKWAREGKKNLGLFIVGLHILIAVFGIALQNFFYGNWNFEWLVQVLFPAYAILSAIFITQTLNFKLLRAPIYLVVFGFVILSSKVILTSPNSYNLADKTEAVKYAIREVGQDQFSLDSIGQNFSYGGYRYLFYLYGHEPLRSYTDPAFAGWLYPKNNFVGHPQKVVAIANPDFFTDPDYLAKYNRYLAKTVQKQRFGTIEVLIVDNSEKWIDW